MSDYGDRYYTPPPLTRLLLERGQWSLRWSRLHGAPLTIAEPFAGDGWITRVLEEAGHTVIAGDVNPRALCEHAGLDFFSKRADRVYAGVDVVISNPPFSAAPACVRRAREFADLVVMLLPLGFFEPCASKESSRRADLVQDACHAIIMPRVSFIQGGEGTDRAPCAWYFWHRGAHAHADENGEARRRTWDVITESEYLEAAGQGDLVRLTEELERAVAAKPPAPTLGPLAEQADMFTTTDTTGAAS